MAREFNEIEIRVIKYLIRRSDLSAVHVAILIEHAARTKARFGTIFGPLLDQFANDPAIGDFWLPEELERLFDLPKTGAPSGLRPAG